MSAPITQALLSVSDKTGLAAFARGLAELGVALLSTGGTAIDVTDVNDAPVVADQQFSLGEDFVVGDVVGGESVTPGPYPVGAQYGASPSASDR